MVNRLWLKNSENHVLKSQFTAPIGKKGEITKAQIRIEILLATSGVRMLTIQNLMAVELSG